MSLEDLTDLLPLKDLMGLSEDELTGLLVSDLLSGLLSDLEL